MSRTTLRKRAGFVASVGVAALLCSSSLTLAQTVGDAASFAVKGGSAVNINGTGTVINGDVGVSTGTSITGTFVVTSPYILHSANDTATTNAQASILTLYNSLGAGSGSPIGPELSNLVLGPGTYDIGAGSLSSPGGSLTGNLTLSGAGTYIFRASSSLTANVLSTVTLIGVDPCQVFWRVPTQATINGVNFVGNVISDNSGPGVVLGQDAILTGRALTTVAAAVTMAGNNTVGGCSGGTVNVTKTTGVATDNGTFSFTGDLGPFDITTVGGTGTKTFTNVPPGPLSIAEIAPSGWTLGTNGCASVTVPAGGGTVRLHGDERQKLDLSWHGPGPHPQVPQRRDGDGHIRWWVPVPDGRDVGRRQSRCGHWQLCARQQLWRSP